MNIVEKYEWSRSTEEEVMQDKLPYDALYTTLSDGTVIWETEISRQGMIDSSIIDLRSSSTVQRTLSTFTGSGERYAHARSNRHTLTKTPFSHSYRNDSNPSRLTLPQDHHHRDLNKTSDGSDAVKQVIGLPISSRRNPPR